MRVNETKSFQDIIFNPLPKIIGVIVLILVFGILFGTFYTIQAGERGVLLTFGKADMAARTEGLHIKMPFVQAIKKMDIKTQKYEATLTAASKDLQDVNTGIAINFHIVPESVPTLYTTIGMDYAEKVIYPYEQETNKGITSQFTAEELITKREQVREKMKIDLAEKLRPRGIIIEEVSIINFAFSPSFTQAIELKVTAEQQALTSRNKLEQIKYEAQQVEAAAIGQKNAAIAQAQGQSESIRIINEQLERSPEYLDYYRLTKWNGILPMVMGTGATPLIDVSAITK